MEEISGSSRRGSKVLKMGADRSLIDFVFSWSMADALNKKLFQGQVKKIPLTFKSRTEYLHSFLAPLIEETHAELLSGLKGVSHAPSCEVYSGFMCGSLEDPIDLSYMIYLRKSDMVTYQPQVGDLVALTDKKPECISDLNRPKAPYILAHVISSGILIDNERFYTLLIETSKPIMIMEQMRMQRGEGLLEQSSDNLSQQQPTLFIVFLINMTTNIRIWNALHPDPKGENLEMIDKVVQMNGADEEDCTMCFFERKCGTALSFKSYGLNDSQEAVIISCIDSQWCYHDNTVKLIWGPPGTGKTKTVGYLLFALLRMKCSAVTCAPTNIAVVEVASSFMSLVTGTLEYDTYRFGDVVLFGNEQRMSIDDHEDLHNIFLDYRAKILGACFSPTNGWKISLVSMINILEDPEEQYRLYLAKHERKKTGEENCENQTEKSTNHKMEGENSDVNLKNKKGRYHWRKLIIDALKRKETKKRHVNCEMESGEKPEEKEDRHRVPLGKANAQEAETGKDNPLTLVEFFKKKFSKFNERLKFCVVNLYTHLPTDFISLQVVKEMMLALDLLRSLETLMNCSNFSNKGLKEALNYTVERSEVGHLKNLTIARKNCLKMLKSLPESFQVPEFIEESMIKRFCLENASLIFCTVSSSCKLSSRSRPLDLLVIDEAAQLKECESTIPFQLRGLRHAILVGDERQLPAMIQSKISGEAEFGRSLFERLVLLGQKRQLLNIQYRMHPAISLFPNKEFYDGRILDAPMVKDRSHEKQLLHGSMYGSYSFINVACGKEQNDQHSLKNTVEVAVVCQIVASLFKEFTSTKQRICIGVISPYKAQVLAIQEKLELKYGEYTDSGFNVRARTVDGFQGGEEDVIIISTVRCNINGSVGFLSNHQRTNVALTRARHCLWILGNEATLIKSVSVWKKLVTDAKKRGCFFNADEDKNLVQAIITSLLELEQFDTLGSMVSLLLKDARWKINFSNDFWKSMSSLKNAELHNQMLNLLQKLSTGWRHKKNNHNEVGDSCGMLQVYPVNGSSKYLLWSVEIIKENTSHFIQVLKVWDVLPMVDIPKAAKRLEMLFGEYTVNKMNRCKVQRVEGKLVVPMRWPVEEFSIGSIGHKDDNLSRPFASLGVSDKSSASTAKFNFRCWRPWGVKVIGFKPKP